MNFGPALAVAFVLWPVMAVLGGQGFAPLLGLTSLVALALARPLPLGALLAATAPLALGNALANADGVASLLACGRSVAGADARADALAAADGEPGAAVALGAALGVAGQ